MIHLATSCFPNCQPANGSGFSTGNGDGAILGIIAILLFVLYLMRNK